jgi:hypothetical protein
MFLNELTGQQLLAKSATDHSKGFDMANNIVAPMIESPTKPGFYKYSGGNQNVLFYLDSHGQWFVWSTHDPANSSECAWGYIEQCLSVWTLERIE